MKKEKKHLNAQTLHKMWNYMKKVEKPSKEALDRLALFAGFQCWEDFQDALHGDDDAQVNYEGREKKIELADEDDL